MPRTGPIGLLIAAAVIAVPLAQGPAKPAAQPPAAAARLEALKQEAAADVERRGQFSQRMVDQLFSYGELGFQEIETNRYLIAILKENGFAVQEGIAGVPTAFMATWGSGKPVLALGSDIDCIPQASQKPGVAWHDPIIEGAPGHGEGHNSGQAVNITAAIAVKKIMEREHLPGTIRIWPGTAEELVGTKAYYIRAGLFKDVDVALFTHVDDSFDVSWGDRAGTGLVSVQYSFLGETAHAAASPWRGKSALDAVELMDIGWNFRREHLRLSQRSHSVIVDGGDQPNVVPRSASVWYYFREIDFLHIKEMWETGDTIARAAAMMAGVELQPTKVLGSAWPQHFNKIVAETAWANIQKVGMPQWSAEDQQLATALQKELKNPRTDGLRTKLADTLPGPVRENTGGGSDDIGDISWNVPTVTMRYPSNIPNLPGHNWANAIAMATPIAHKGVTAGAKAQAMTILDLVSRPELVEQAWQYFREVQTKDTKYEPLLRPQDQPAIWLNKGTMDKYRPEMKKYYYDPSRYATYLEQLGIKYPTVRSGSSQ
ncbi:MAG TPA: peptidase dimerization domain-containing protein [Vicinamibacterales bacterium]|nr:peptidase dimerization domain-containing protein [Vicinamibacterales bacterium]